MSFYTIPKVSTTYYVISIFALRTWKGLAEHDAKTWTKLSELGLTTWEKLGATGWRATFIIYYLVPIPTTTFYEVSL